jgi:hypothetical protein
VVCDRRRPILFVECKLADTEIDRGLRYLHERWPDVPAWQLCAMGTKDYVTPTGIRVAPAIAFLRELV